MANTLQIRRGTESTIPSLAAGEPGFSTDTKKGFIGDSSTNHRLTMHNDFDAAHSILRANAAGAPAAVGIGAGEIVGRNGSGNISGLTAATILSLLSGEAGAAFSMNNQRITNIPAPQNANDAVSMVWVQDLVSKGMAAHEAVLDKDTLTPPASPTSGDRYLIGGTGAGSWTGHDYEVAEYNGSAWVYEPMTDGDFAWVTDENIFYYYDVDTITLKKLNTEFGAHAASHESTGGDPIEHNKLIDHVPNEHIDHSTVSITGAGLLNAQGGDITASRTFTLNNSDIDHNQLNNYLADKHVSHSSVDMIAGVGLSGGGDIAADRTFNLALNSLTALTTPASGDFIPVVDISDANTQKKVTLANLMSIYIEDNPVSGNTDIGISSNWAYEHKEKTTGTHGVTGNIVGTSDVQELSNKTIDCGTW